MLRSIAVTLDEGSASAAAQDWALALAQRTGATVTGLAVLDAERLAPPAPSRAGAGAFQAHRDKVVLDDARARLDGLTAGFTQAASKAGVASVPRRIEAPAEQALRETAEGADLLVIGRDCDFVFTDEASLSSAVRTLLRETPRPFVLVPAEPSIGTGVLVAYDGSIEAMRALLVFALLRPCEGERITVVSVAPEQDQARSVAERATAYLRLHDLEADAVGIAHADPSDALLAEVQARKPALLVMGAYGRAGWREALWGGTTDHLLERTNCPLFLLH